MKEYGESYAVRARTIVPMTNEKAARGKDLFEPISSIDNGVLLVHKNYVVACGKKKDLELPKGLIVHDLGDVSLIPGVINCHAHIDISHLAGKTQWGAGFSAWLTSLIPLCPRHEPEDTREIDAAREKALAQCAMKGTACIGSIASPSLRTLAALENLANKKGIRLIHLCEAFGQKINALATVVDDMHKECPNALLSAAGHALYSTTGETLKAASRIAASFNRRMSLHLAESPEEVDMLTSGRGELYEIFTHGVLPPSWTVPKMRPVPLANSLGLLSNLLAVHCVHVSEDEAELLAAMDVAVCLCPRSNANLACGTARVETFIEKGILLCLGTDGLTSSPDLDVIQEACFLKKTKDLPANALLRMLTVNGAYALGLPLAMGRLAPGSPARFALLPSCLELKLSPR
ncbi:MAG: amidohydrolase family protein [Desulfovibrionaceae bacterium]|nr:amidohydrolase family protein [Desulfovibrionaceae bacterium]